MFVLIAALNFSTEHLPRRTQHGSINVVTLSEGFLTHFHAPLVDFRWNLVWWTHTWRHQEVGVERVRWGVHDGQQSAVAVLFTHQ